MVEVDINPRFEAAAKALSEIAAKLEIGRIAVDGPKTAYFEIDHEPRRRFVYLSARSGGLTCAGAKTPVLFSDPMAAVEAWKSSITAYIEANKGIIVWRMRPVLEDYDGYYSVYSRVVVADVGGDAMYIQRLPLVPDEPKQVEGA